MANGDLANTDSLSLPRLVDRAAKALQSAHSAAEVLEAGRMADVAYSAAKLAGRMSKATKAHATVVAACHRAQADALEIEAGAKRRLADEVDTAQDRGEIASQGKPSRTKGLPTAADVGLTAKQVHEARTVRDAERDDPGIVKRTLDDLVAKGKEPTKAALRKATRTSSKQDTVSETEPDEDETESAPKSGTYDSSTPAQRKTFFIFQTNQIIGDAEFDGVPDDNICAAARRVVTTWTKFAATLEKRLPVAKKATTDKLKKRRKKANRKIDEDYFKQFGLFRGRRDPASYKLTADSLASGVDQLAKKKHEHDRKHAEYIRAETQRRADLNAPLLAPITSEKEQAYTRLIKTRTLYEGACELSWPEYFEHREAHPECEALTWGDLTYAAQWTMCAVVPALDESTITEAALRDRAARLGYKVRRRGTQYNLTDDDGPSSGGTLKALIGLLDMMTPTSNEQKPLAA